MRKEWCHSGKNESSLTGVTPQEEEGERGIINPTWTLSGECNIKKYKYKVQSKCTKKLRVETPARRKEAMEGAQVCYSGTKAIPAMTVDKTRLIFPVL
jgi:hypothetical protein